MQKIKSALDMEAYGRTALVSASSLMMVCFVAGAVILNTAWGHRAGYLVMGAGLLLSMFIWTVFFAESQQ